MTQWQGTEVATVLAAHFAEMEWLTLFAVYVSTHMRQQPRWNRQDTLHPFGNLRILGVLERLMSAGKSSFDRLGRRINLANSLGRTWLRTRMRFSTQVMRAGSEPVEVRLGTESFAELARLWAEP